MEPQEYDCEAGTCPVRQDNCLTMDDNPVHIAGQSTWWMTRCPCCGEIWAFEDRPLTERESGAILLPPYEL